MRLAAIYVQKHFLFDEPQIINLGGKKIYNFKIHDNKLSLFVKHENENFLDDFWGYDIALVTAIVGENATGKTSLLKEIIMTGERLRNESLYDNIALIYEDEDGFSISTKLELHDENLKSEVSHKIKYEYYSPTIDYDLIDIFSALNLSRSFESSLEEYFVSNLNKQILFNYSPRIAKIRDSIEIKFPVIKGITIKGKLQYKVDFEKVYSLSNLQNGMSIALQKLWEKYKNTNPKYDQFTHSQNNFYKNIEVNILAILIVNNTYTEVPGSGNSIYHIGELLEGDFIAVLDKFKKQYIYVINVEIYQEYEKMRYSDFKEYLKKNIRSESFDPFQSTINVLDLFDAIELFYNDLSKLKERPGFDIKEDQIIYNNNNNDLKITKSITLFINNYEKLLKILQKTPLSKMNLSLLEFGYYDSTTQQPQRLSTGEKALLNLYSTIYSYANDLDHIEESENFILLLDEADLGYHPEWKKKFVNSIVKILPPIFKEIKHFKKLQIIFTTHDPLSLSDIPNNNVVYLMRKNNGKTEVLNGDKRPQKSFGANITNLLADSFFFGIEEKSLIGDFAKEKIEKTIRWLNDKKKEKEEKQKNKKTFRINLSEKKYYETIIKIIDEPIIKIKLAEMLDDLYDKNKIQEELIKNEIDFLTKKLNKLKI